MGIIDRLKGFLGGSSRKEARLDYAPGGAFWQVPPSRTAASYIAAYKSVGWLNAPLSRISSAVGEARWRLYRISSNAKRTEIANHPLLDLLRYVNPHQTGHELFELTQLYLDLLGESFWVFSLNKLRLPGEIWIAPPYRMKVLPDKRNFIAGYEYQNGTNTIRFNPDEVLYIRVPDPGNPYRGVGPVQAISADIDIEQFTREWERRFFYNSATPVGILNIPGAEDESLQRFREEWKQNYGGYMNAHKIAFLNAEDIKYERTGLTQREMDFWRSSKANRDRLLGGLGIPLSVMGISENVNRANAEAGSYVFASGVIRPRLVRIREKLNEQLVPRFGKDLILDFDDPVPESREAMVKQNETGVKAGYLTINEARQALGYDPIPKGDILLIPLNLMPQPIKQVEVGIKVTKFAFETEDEKETYWKAYRDKTESQEKPIIATLRRLFKEQQEEVEGKLKPGVDPEKILNLPKAKREFMDNLRPLMLDILAGAIEDGDALVRPENPHKTKQGDIINEEALEWLGSHMAWAAEEVGEKTASMLAKAIKEGFEAGESMDGIASRVKGVFDICSDSRALKIARTEVIMASNEGRLFGYEESGVVEKVEFYAALDERACPDCEDLHGTIFTMAEAHGIIPVHPDCRCVFLPVV